MRPWKHSIVENTFKFILRNSILVFFIIDLKQELLLLIQTSLNTKVRHKHKELFKTKFLTFDLFFKNLNDAVDKRVELELFQHSYSIYWDLYALGTFFLKRLNCLLLLFRRNWLHVEIDESTVKEL